MIWFKILLGPVIFLLMIYLPIEIDNDAKMVIGLYAWMIAWWVTQPIPWGVTALLPLVILPVIGLFTLEVVASLYGHQAFFIFNRGHAFWLCSS